MKYLIEAGQRMQLAATNKCLAQISKTGAGVRATKGHQREGDMGEAKNKHLLPPPHEWRSRCALPIEK